MIKEIINMESYKYSYGQFEDDKSIVLEIIGDEEKFHSCQFCIGDDGKVITLTNSDKTTKVRIKREDYDLIGYPKFLPGDRVERIDGTRTGVVYNVLWIEHSDGNPDYFAYLLDYPDRRSTRWNKEEELRKVE